MVLQLLCNGNFNEMGSSFRKVFLTNMAVSIPFALAMPDHVTFGLAHKVEKFPYCCVAVIRLTM